MLEPDDIPKMQHPIDMGIYNGALFARDLWGYKRVWFESVRGCLVGIFPIKKGAYDYWEIKMQDTDPDNGNTYLLQFPQESGLFKDIVLRLANVTDYTNIRIEGQIYAIG